MMRQSESQRDMAMKILGVGSDTKMSRNLCLRIAKGVRCVLDGVFMRFLICQARKFRAGFIFV